MADYLKRFRDLKIPILWRPLHEAEGGWFWWGARGPEPCRKLYHLMYDRFTNIHRLDNLIWVWNSIDPEWYPGDDCVDIISCDIYVRDDNPLKEQFDGLSKLSENKMMALAECGVHPDADKMKEAGAMWLWSMAWCFGDMLTSKESPFPDYTPEEWGKRQEEIKKRYRDFYNNENVITLQDLPWR